MPGLFVLAIIFAIIGVLAVAGYAAVKVLGDPHDADTASLRHVVAGFGAVFVLGAIVTTFASSFNSVGTYDIGVTTNFGKVISYVGPGAHFIPPWDNMAILDESTQPVNDTITVRVAGQQTAQIPVNLRVQLNPKAVDSTFKLYKGNTQAVIKNLVEPELNVAMNSVYDGYDPILPLSTNAKPGTPDNPTTGQLGAEVKARLVQAIGSQVIVGTLVVKPPQYDQTVENRINSVLAQTAKTDVAKQSVVTAENQARANEVLKQNVTPLTLVQQCMTAIADGQLNPPAGFSCWPGSGSGVVIPSGK